MTTSPAVQPASPTVESLPAAPRLAVVTGASRGIGRALALRLAADGYDVGVHYGTNHAAADEVVAQIRALGRAAFAFSTDLAGLTAADEFWAAFDAARPADLAGAPVQALVNNAGICLVGTIEETTPEDFDRQLTINTRTPYFIVREGLTRLADGGRVIMISSAATRIAHPGIFAYAPTKGAIDAFTKTLAAHLGPRNITVNAVAPGVTDTDMVSSWLSEAQAETAAESAFNRIGTPAEVAGIVSFLAAPESSWVTGQIIDATGGAGL